MCIIMLIGNALSICELAFSTLRMHRVHILLFLFIPRLALSKDVNNSKVEDREGGQNKEGYPSKIMLTVEDILNTKNETPRILSQSGMQDRMGMGKACSRTCRLWSYLGFLELGIVLPLQPSEKSDHYCGWRRTHHSSDIRLSKCRLCQSRSVPDPWSYTESVWPLSSKWCDTLQFKARIPLFWISICDPLWEDLLQQRQDHSHHPGTSWATEVLHHHQREARTEKCQKSWERDKWQCHFDNNWSKKCRLESSK